MPEPWLSKYRGRYDQGYDAIRNARIARLQALGIIPYSWTPHPVSPEVLAPPLPDTRANGSPNNGTADAKYISAVHPLADGYVDYGAGYVNKSWASLSAAEKKAQSRYMEIYAVRCMIFIARPRRANPPSTRCSKRRSA